MRWGFPEGFGAGKRHKMRIFENKMEAAGIESYLPQACKQNKCDSNILKHMKSRKSRQQLMTKGCVYFLFLIYPKNSVAAILL